MLDAAASSRKRWEESEKKIKRPGEFLSVIMDTSKESGVFNEDRPPIASHRR